MISNWMKRNSKLKSVTTYRTLSTLWFHFKLKTNDKSKRVRERLTLLCTNSSWTKVKYCVFVCTKPCKHPNENKHSDGCWYNHSSAKCLANTSQHWSAALIDGTRAFMYKIYIFMHHWHDGWWVFMFANLNWLRLNWLTANMHECIHAVLCN